METKIYMKHGCVQWMYSCFILIFLGKLESDEGEEWLLAEDKYWEKTDMLEDLAIAGESAGLWVGQGRRRYAVVQGKVVGRSADSSRTLPVFGREWVCSGAKVVDSLLNACPPFWKLRSCSPHWAYLDVKWSFWAALSVSGCRYVGKGLTEHKKRGEGERGSHGKKRMPQTRVVGVLFSYWYPMQIQHAICVCMKTEENVSPVRSWWAFLLWSQKCTAVGQLIASLKPRCLVSVE